MHLIREFTVQRRCSVADLCAKKERKKVVLVLRRVAHLTAAGTPPAPSSPSPSLPADAWCLLFTGGSFRSRCVVGSRAGMVGGETVIGKRRGKEIWVEGFLLVFGVLRSSGLFFWS